MRKTKSLISIKIMAVMLLIVLFPACSSQVEDVSTSVPGVSIARRGESLLPTEADTAAEAPGTPDETAEPPTNTPVQETQTETPTVPGSGPSRTPEQTLTAIETDVFTTVTPTATAEPIVCHGEINRAFESAVIGLINQERSKASLTPLAEQSQLTQTARSHAEDMACNGFFDHSSPTAGGVIDRVTAQGYDFSVVGEIIAGGFADAESVVAGWMSSPEHSRNILSREFTQIGVGYSKWDDSSYETYWVVVFGKP